LFFSAVFFKNSTESFLTLVERAQLLPREQLDEIRRLGHKEHQAEHCQISTLKRSSSSHETSGPRTEKFAKIGFDAEGKHFIEDRELYLLEETSDDRGDDHLVKADQEVPKEANNNSSGHLVDTTAHAQRPEDANSVTFNECCSERPVKNFEINNLSWQGLTGLEKSLSHEESNNERSCAESFCLKFGGENRESPENTKQGFAFSCLTDEQSKIISDLSRQRQQTVTTSNEHVVPNIAWNFPLLPPRTTNESDLCSSVRAIGERDLIDDVSNS